MDCAGCGRDSSERAGLCSPIPLRRRSAETGFSVRRLHGGAARPGLESEQRLFVLDHVIGKHLYIDYAVSLDRAGRVHRVDILQYRESYGGEVRGPSWLAQFVGKSSGSLLKVGGDIRNISGATLSSEHVTEGVKRILAAYGHAQ